MSKHMRFALVLVTLAALVPAGWSRPAFGASGRHTAAQVGAGRVALLLPEQFTGRWVKDAAYFQAKLRQLDPAAVVSVSNANANANLQLSQANAALSAGAKVLVIGSVDQNAAAPIVARAARAGAQVIAYDRAIQSPMLRYYDSFDGLAVGRLQGRWLANHVSRGGTIVVINGSQTDDNAHLFNQGYMSVLRPAFRAGTFRNGGEYWTDQWLPARAGVEMANALTRNRNNVAGVLSANDGMAAAIVAQLRRVGKAGLPVTGQDAQPDALGRIIAGTQGMSVYKPLYREANAAAIATNALLRGRPVPNFNQMYRTKVTTVHAAIFAPVLITRNNVNMVVRDGFATWAQVCAGIGPARPLCR